MKYYSTRGGVSGIRFQDAVMMGLAEDGGLLLPDEFPFLGDELESLRNLAYPELAFEIISRFVDDIPMNALRELINKSYATFDDNRVIPVTKLKSCYLAELYHGPTYAFKDVALQFLGNLFEYIMTKRDMKLNILGATSGDTGSAAIYGVRGKKNVTISILYPDGRVSAVQELQMTSVGDKNVFTYAVDGTFDDCQYIVKELFGDLDFKKQMHLGAVNSINWARILAQIVYYFYAWFRLPSKEAAYMVVPTGNFGNIFAGYCAKKMGLPIEKLVLATNANNILHRFIASGDYSLREVVGTHSPSMDIQVASNLERYLYFLYGQNSGLLKRALSELKSENRINFSDVEMKKVREEFISADVDNAASEKAIKRVHDEDKLVIEPHTACGVEAAYRLGLPAERTICFSTAHPAKFPDVVQKVLGFLPDKPAGIAKLDGAARRTEKLKNSADAVRAVMKSKLTNNI